MENLPILSYTAAHLNFKNTVLIISWTLECNVTSKFIYIFFILFVSFYNVMPNINCSNVLLFYFFTYLLVISHNIKIIISVSQNLNAGASLFSSVHLSVQDYLFFFIYSPPPPIFLIIHRRPQSFYWKNAHIMLKLYIMYITVITVLFIIVLYNSIVYILLYGSIFWIIILNSFS